MGFSSSAQPTYWSDPFTGTDTSITIDHGLASVHVTENGVSIANAPVYVFTSAGTYLSIQGYTDSSGVVQFLFPDKSFKFRVDYNGTQHWSDEIAIIPMETIPSSWTSPFWPFN